MNNDTFSCDFCDSCNLCSYCYGCNYCKNLRMTEYNTFCYSVQYGDKNSHQQKVWRVFNKEVGFERYYQISKLIKNIIPNKNNINLKDFWSSITQSQWQQLLEIPEAKDFKEGFEFISGQKINIDSNILFFEGKKYKLIEED